MTKNQKIDELFNKIVLKNPEMENRIKKDGIINEQIFDRQQNKILFICKEGNDPKQNEGDFRSWWREELWGIHANRIGTWAYGILEDFPKLEDISRKQKKDALSRIAFINLKKIGGKSNSNYSEIENHVRATKEELLEQIEIINPDIIIGGITWMKLWEELFSPEQIRHEDDVFDWRGRKIIHYYHPSARKSNKILYEELKRKINTVHNNR